MTEDYDDQVEEDTFDPREASGVTIEDFRAHGPSNMFIYTPCREPWPAASVNARLEPVPLLDGNGNPVRKNGKPVYVSATTWLAQNKSIEQVLWVPGEPMDMSGRLMVEGGWIDRPGAAILNLYRPPRQELGDASKAGLWIDHIHGVFSSAGDADHIINWLAHRVQRPQEKINHALVLGGDPGIGKDTALEPVKYAVGHWNFREITPSRLSGEFNPYIKSVILRINEARDLGDTSRIDRYSFYEKIKNLAAAPPDVLPVNDKYLREQSAINCLGLIITTNHKTDGIYLPAEDRRHFVGWSECKMADFPDGYWNEIWGYYEGGGYGHVTAYLAQHDLSRFDPKAPPRKTAAFWAMVGANRAPEVGEIADVIDEMGSPAALTIAQLTAAAKGSAGEWLLDRRNRRTIPHRLESCGYVFVPNVTAKDHYWMIGGRRHPVYARDELSERDRIMAAQKLKG